MNLKYNFSEFVRKRGLLIIFTLIGVIAAYSLFDLVQSVKINNAKVYSIQSKSDAHELLLSAYFDCASGQPRLLSEYVLTMKQLSVLEGYTEPSLKRFILI